jgi:predicted nuclease of predicted toxin-antitoxin system
MNSGPADKFVFLVDVNLPRKFRFFNNPNFIHVADINPSMTDKMIWDYALKHDCVILTKDTDFYTLFLLNEVHPKVIYFQIGNFTLAALHQYFQNYWESILNHLSTSSFIIAGSEKINVLR